MIGASNLHGPPRDDVFADFVRALGPWLLQVAECRESERAVTLRVRIPASIIGTPEVHVRTAANRDRRRPDLMTVVFIRCSGFERSVNIPIAVDARQATATYKPGKLTVVLPKKAAQGVGR
jgi:hypothetical protein